MVVLYLDRFSPTRSLVLCAYRESLAGGNLEVDPERRSAGLRSLFPFRGTGDDVTDPSLDDERQHEAKRRVLTGDAIAKGDGVPLSRVLLATTSLQQGKGREINK